MDNMPACMMPDGAEPCASWTEQRKRIVELESALRERDALIDRIIAVDDGLMIDDDEHTAEEMLDIQVEKYSAAIEDMRQAREGK